jgi:glycosyltransferase involved in cell wall biosynthesis
MHKALSKFEPGKVSIIIPVYNREILLPETLNSILAQTYSNWECIIVDDGSSDGTLSVCYSYSQKDSRFKIFSRPATVLKGANGCRNFGYKQANGEFIQWFDSDDLMAEDLLSSAILNIGQDNDIVISGAAFFDVDLDQRNGKTIHYRTIGRNSIVEILTGTSHFGTPQAFFKKAFLDCTNEIFNEKLKRNQETEFFIRLLLRNPSVSINQKTTVFIRSHQYSISGNYVQFSEEEKLLANFPAYSLIYAASKMSNELSPELLNLFKDYFYRCLRKMKYDFWNLIKLFYLGIKDGLFPSRLIALKIFIYRLLFNV